MHGGPTTLVSNSAAISDPEPEGLGPGDLGPVTWALPASLPHGSWDCLLILKWFLAQMRAPQGQNRGLWVPRMVSGVQKGGEKALTPLGGTLTQPSSDVPLLAAPARPPDKIPPHIGNW